MFDISTIISEQSKDELWNLSLQYRHSNKHLESPESHHVVAMTQKQECETYDHQYDANNHIIKHNPSNEKYAPHPFPYGKGNSEGFVLESWMKTCKIRQDFLCSENQSPTLDLENKH